MTLPSIQPEPFPDAVIGKFKRSEAEKRFSGPGLECVWLVDGEKPLNLLPAAEVTAGVRQ